MKKRVECRLEEDLVDRIDRTAGLLNMTRTDFITQACLAQLGHIRTNRKSLKADY